MFKRIFAFILGLLIQAQFGVVINPVHAATTEAECKTMAGKVWDGRLNACVTSAQTSKIQNQVKNACKDLTGEAYQNCYYNNALSAIQEDGVRDNEKVEGTLDGGTSSAISMIATLMTAKYLINRKKNDVSCKAPSLWMMLGAGAAAVVGEVLANLNYRRQLKKEIENYEKNVKINENEELTAQEKIEHSSGNQVRAFDFLINQEKHRVGLMKTRKGVYTGVTALYGGAVVLSALESVNITNRANSICQHKSSDSTTEQTSNTSTPTDATQSVDPASQDKVIEEQLRNCPSGQKVCLLNIQKAKENITLLEQIFDDIENGKTGKIISYMIQILAVDSAHAQEVTKSFKNYKEDDVVSEFNKILKGATIGLGAAAGVGIVAKKFTGKALDTIFTTPEGRGIYAGVLGGYSFAVMKEAQKQQKISEERQEAVQKIKDGIVNSPATISGCTSEDRNNSAKPECYCYIEGSQKNTKRSRQTVCKNQWGEMDILTANNYNLNGGDTSSQSSCVNSAYKVDESCSCKKASGKDSCLSLSNPSGFNSIGAASWGNSIQDTANNLLSGGYGTGEVLENAGNNLAMMNKKVTDKLSKNPKIAGTLKKFKTNSDKLRNSIQQQAGPQLAGFRNPFAAPSSLDNLDPKKAAEEVAKEIAKSAEYESKATKTAEASSESGYDLDFGTSDGAGTTIEDVSEVMDKQFDYGDNDINNRPNDSIFKILTMRYQTSGLRRLFDEKNRFKAEEANANEIHGQQ